ncbi:WXG100 family type VII secretion target [Streptomyces sp. NBC_01013]|uniref:WXG100 family type VII secretion target n=1 Tax=Streptomyces sp. NBC_01013 TaxID=2903718 RepID=UPI003866A1DF|nr:hypothetical protein OG538_21315 [Streptomyces sp. NBC_01013]
MGDSGKLPPLNACYNTSDFEHASYEDMLAMVRGVDPTAIMGRGTALVDAQTEIEKIGTELKEHVGRTTWKGAGGDAFREWGDDFAKETLKLADYAGAAGTSLQTAGQALSEVAKVIQGHPDATLMCYADEKKEKARIAAVETARNEAIPQMNKLASYYMMAQQSISSQEEPNFKPLPKEVLPDRPYDGGKTSYGTSGSPSSGSTYSVNGPQGSGTSTGDHHYSVSSPGDVSGSSQNGASIVHTPQHVSAVPSAPDTTGTNIDTVTMPQAPPTTAPLPTGGLPPQGPGGGGLQTPPPPMVVPPRQGPVNSGNYTVRPPTTGPGGRGGVDAVRPPTTIPGRGGVEGVRPPLSTTRTDTGIHGGTPAQGGRTGTGPVRGTPRGTVIGGEKPSAGRGMMPGHAGGGPGMTGRPGGLGGGSQRLVTEPGGTVRAPRGTQPGAGREFTQGGTGLVRESSRTGGAMGPMGGAMGGASKGTRRPQRRDGGNPGYLEEDEESWTTGDDGVVPPVID